MGTENPIKESRTIVGRVMYPDKVTPADNFTIILNLIDGTNITSTVSDKDGVFTFDNLNSNLDIIKVNDNGSIGNTQVHLSKQNKTKQNKTKQNNNNNNNNIYIRPLGTNSISGQVKYDDGSPVPKAIITYALVEGGREEFYIADNNGQFQLKQLQSGQFIISASEPVGFAFKTTHNYFEAGSDTLVLNFELEKDTNKEGSGEITNGNFQNDLSGWETSGDGSVKIIELDKETIEHLLK